MRSLVMFLHLLSLTACAAFCLPASSRLPAQFFREQWRTNKRPTMTINQGNANTNSDTASTNDVNVSVNGADAGADVSSVGGLVTASDAKSQLFSAFTALDLPDQYDAVLTGLCAKILDNDVPVQSGEAIGKNTGKALLDPMQLLQEMNQKKIVASPRSIMALIDVRTAATCRLLIEFWSACLLFNLPLTSLFVSFFICAVYSQSPRRSINGTSTLAMFKKRWRSIVRFHAG
jgi:hypothetical protein